MELRYFGNIKEMEPLSQDDQVRLAENIYLFYASPLSTVNNCQSNTILYNRGKIGVWLNIWAGKNFKPKDKTETESVQFLKDLFYPLEGPVEVLLFDNEWRCKPDDIFMGFFAEKPFLF